MACLIPSMRKRASKRMMVQASTSSSGKVCGSKCQRLKEWMSRDLTASGRSFGTLNILKRKVKKRYTRTKDDIRINTVVVDRVQSLGIHIAQQFRVDGPV